MVKSKRHWRRTCVFRAPIVCALLVAAWCAPRAAQAQSAPVLISEATSTRAVALDPLTGLREPFSPISTSVLYPNQPARVQLFALNLSLSPGESASRSEEHTSE